MNKRIIKVAAIGTEGYAYSQLERILSLAAHYELVGVCGEPLRRERGYPLCLKHGIPVFDSSEELLGHAKENQVEAVFIFTGIDSHYTYACQCLKAGFEVFLEKPPVPTIQQLDDLTTLEGRTGRRIAVLFQYLYSRIVQQLKQRIVSGEFGKTLRVRSLAAWQRPDDYFRRTNWCGVVKTARGEWVLDGTLNNPLAHVLSNSLYLASMEPEAMATPLVIQAELYKVHDIESEDTSSTRILCENGCVITNNATLCSESEVRSETIVECEKAVIRYLNFNTAQIVFRDGRPAELIEDLADHRLHMLEDVAVSFKSGLRYKVPLRICRPFTLCVNGAFDSSGQANPIDHEHVIKDRREGLEMTLIRDITPIMQQAHLNSQLLSEAKIPWAKSGRLIHMKEYNRFPGNPPQETVV